MFARCSRLNLGRTFGGQEPEITNMFSLAGSPDLPRSADEG